MILYERLLTFLLFYDATCPCTSLGNMPMPAQARTGSFSFFSLRLWAFALPFSSLFPSAALAGYSPETEPIAPKA